MPATPFGAVDDVDAEFRLISVTPFGPVCRRYEAWVRHHEIVEIAASGTTFEPACMGDGSWLVLLRNFLYAAHLLACPSMSRVLDHVVVEFPDSVYGTLRGDTKEVYRPRTGSQKLEQLLSVIIHDPEGCRSL